MEIKQELDSEKHSERRWWKETSDNDDTFPETIYTSSTLTTEDTFLECDESNVKVEDDVPEDTHLNNVESIETNNNPDALDCTMTKVEEVDEPDTHETSQDIICSTQCCNPYVGVHEKDRRGMNKSENSQQYISAEQTTDMSVTENDQSLQLPNKNEISNTEPELDFSRETTPHCDPTSLVYRDVQILHRKPIQKSYTCNICYLQFTRQNSLNKHERIHTGERPYKCDVCDLDFTRSGHLKTHKRIHTGEKPYRCDICIFDFTSNSNLQRHKRKHTGEKPFKCDDCGFAFTCSSSLKTHKRIHTGEKPYRCDICDLHFKQIGHLKTHTKIHTGEKHYKCDVCDLDFTQKSHLKSHSRVHTGERPYKCDICIFEFTSNSNLQRHKKKHTGEKPFKCDDCDITITCSSSLITKKNTYRREVLQM